MSWGSRLILFKGVSKTIQYKAKEQIGGFLSVLVGTLGASFLGGKGEIAKRQGRGIYRAGEGVIRAGYGNKRQNYEKKKDF